jgi:hypothetical protein
MAETNKQKLNRLYSEYNLSSDDVFKHKLGFSIITRTGIEKIQAGIGLSVRYEMVRMSDDHKFVVVKGIGTMDGTIVESYGEATPENNRMSYPVAMAEKRALSRVVLKAAGFYALGVYGEDEADDFKDRKGSTPAIEAPAPKKPNNIDEILKATKIKLEKGEVNPIQVKDWMSKNKTHMTEAQLSWATEIITPYI